MSEENYTHSIELIGGYEDKKGVAQHEVIFGKRPTVADLMALDRDPQAKNSTQYEDLIRRLMITKFGTLTIPVPLSVMLSLDSIDRDDLGAAANEFLRLSRGENSGEMLAGDKVKLAFGMKIESAIYDTVEFGNRLIGRDDVEADALGLQGVSRLCFFYAKQIIRLSDSVSGLTLECANDADQKDSFSLTLEHLSKLDAEDFNLLRIGAELFRQSFRFKRGNLSKNENGEGSVSTDERDGDARGGNTESADRKN